MPRGSVLPDAGLLRTVVRRARADLPFTVAVWVLLASAVTLIAASVLYGDTVAQGGIRRAIEAAPPADQGVTVTAALQAGSLASLDGAVRQQLRAALAPADTTVALGLRSTSFAPITAGAASAPGGALLTALASDDGLAAHATLVAGAWSRPGQTPMQATISRDGATALGLHVGDRVPLADASTPGASQTVAVTEVVVTGIWTTDPSSGYWLGDPFVTTGIGPGASRGPLFVTPADLLTIDGSGLVTAQWRAIPDPSTVLPADVAAIHQRLAGLPTAVRTTIPYSSSLAVSGGLAALLDGVARASLVNGSNVGLLTLQFAVLAGYAVLLVGGMLGDRRRAHVALIRSRGASPWHVAALAVAEALLLALPATGVALGASYGLVWSLGHVGPLATAGIAASVHPDGAVLVAAAAAGLAGVLVLALPVATTGAHLGGIRAAMARPLSRTLGQRLGLDGALVAIAAVAIWQLRLYGGTLTHDLRGRLGIDPLLVAAPALGLAAGAILATRLMPRLAELGERLVGRARGLVAALGTRQLARRPLRYTRAALLLVLAAAMVTFASVYSTTWVRSQDEQAAYQAAADMRVMSALAAALPSWSVGPAYRALPGVRAAVPVVRQAFRAGTDIRDGQLLAFDPRAAAGIVALPRGTPAGLPTALAALAAARPAVPLVALPGRPTRLVVALEDELTSTYGDDLAIANPLELVVVLEDGDGRLFRLSGGGVAYSDGPQAFPIGLTASVEGTTRAPVYPLSLVEVELRGTRPGLAGFWRVDSVTADAGPGTFASPLALAPQPGTVGPPEDSTAPVTLWSVPVTVPRDLPVVASDDFLELTGTHLGDDVQLSLPAGQVVTVRITAVTPLYPSLDPATSFVIADGPTLDLLRLRDLDDVAPTSEWWLGIAPASAPALAATLSQPPYAAAQVIGRDALAAALVSDPVALGTVGALLLGAVAALAFAAVGFVVSVVVSTSERSGEFALLHALGLSRRQLRRWLTIEQAFLLAIGLVGGMALGLLIAWLVLPYTTLTADGTTPVPAPVIVVPLAVLAVLALLALVLLAATVLVTGRQVPRIRMGTVLRGGE